MESQKRHPRTFSFEFFPPKTAEGKERLRAAWKQLGQLKPKFFSCTFGAGGSTREGTLETVLEIRAAGYEAAPHLSCIASSRAELKAQLEKYQAHGIRHIVALRGDPPANDPAFRPHPDGYEYAADLVAGIRAAGDFEISVAAFPEGHPQAQDLDSDIANLKRKIDAGATRAITQYFFDAATYLRFRDRAAAAGITAPLVPGILPVQNFKATTGFARRCGASVPAWIAERFQGLDDDAATRKLIAAAVAAEQVFDLVDRGVTTFHFYTMNRADLVFAICHLLGLRPAVQTVS